MIAAALASGLCLVGALAGVVTAQAQPASPAPLESVYELGTTVTIPKRELSEGGKRYPAQSVVICPDGRAYSTDVIVADELGRYLVEYRATSDAGTLLTERVVFETQTELYELTGEHSSAHYGVDASDYQTGKTGIAVSLAEGESFRYNDIVDLREMGGEETFLELFALPTQGAGTRDVATIVIKLEDVYDPENIVTIYGRSVESDGGADPWWCNTLYLAAGAAGQTATGIEWGPPIRIHTGRFGYPVPYSLYGYRDYQVSVGKETFGLKFDLQSARLYAPKATGDDYVIDLDAKRYFSNPWSGFTTGEVYVSISAETYFGDTFDFMVTKLGHSDLSAEKVRDRKPPTITVDRQGYAQQELPAASVGVRYPVFAATAHDIFSPSLPVTVKVFYGYTSSTRYELPITEGGFLPDRAGEYTIEYSAQDRYGNVGRVTDVVQCVSAAQPIRIRTEGVPSSGLVGERIFPDVFSAEGGIGRLQKQVIVMRAGEEVALEAGSFLPTLPGDYHVRCTVTDFAGQTQQAEYTIAVQENPNPVFLSEAALPHYFIEGATYALPALSAWQYGEGREIAADIFVTDGTRNAAQVQGATTFTAGKDGNALIVYRAASAGGSAERQYSIPVLPAYTAQTMDADVLFHVEGGNKESLYTGVRFTATDDLIAEHVLALDMRAFQVSFTAEAPLTLTLRDVRTGKQLVIALKEDARTPALYAVTVDGKETGLSALRSARITLEYASQSKTLKLNGAALALAQAPDFAQGAQLSFGSERGGVCTLHSLGGQALTRAMQDKTAPTILLGGEYGGSYPLGSSISLFTAFAFDLISPQPKCMVSVLAPGGSTLQQGGVRFNRLDAQAGYEFVMQEYGTYTVIYEAEDLFGNRTQQLFRLEARDNVAPTIRLMWENETRFKLGDVVTFSKAIVTDDLDEGCKAEYFVLSPRGEITPIYFLMTSETTGSISFVAEERGKHIIRYFATDKAGNVSILDVEIVVE